MVKLCVYGTLRSGGPLNFILNEFKNKYRTTRVKGLKMYNLGGCPGVKLGNLNDEIVAEIWELMISNGESDLFLKTLDFMEGVHTGLYSRRTIKTEHGNAQIYIYNGNVSETNRIYDWMGNQGKFDQTVRSDKVVIRGI
jgi:gamma-glutamylcyclotransferase (GGCT)/AIG2-like uncharacterized protein YtfP